MIRIRCDRCDQTIELAQGVVGQKVTCPHCGDVNVLRSAAGQSAGEPEDRAAKAGYPPANGPEVEVLSVRPAMFRSKPVTFLLLLVGAVGGLGTAIVAMGMGALPIAAIAAVIAAAAGGTLGFWRLFKLSEGMKITTKRIVDREGFFRRETSEILHKDIRNVQVRQSFWQRVWKVGTLAVSTAAENEDEILMHDVPGPDHVRQVIDLYRRI